MTLIIVWGQQHKGHKIGKKGVGSRKRGEGGIGVLDLSASEIDLSINHAYKLRYTPG